MSDSHAGCHGYRFLITEIPALRQRFVTSEIGFYGFYGYHVLAEQWMNIMALVV